MRLAEVDYALGIVDFTDPDPTGDRPVLALDLLDRWRPGADVGAIRDLLVKALADPSISNADLKGALNRATGRVWQEPYQRLFTPREFVEAIVKCLDDHLSARGRIRP